MTQKDMKKNKGQQGPNAEPGLATRFGAVQGYFIDKLNVRFYMPVFIALAPELADHSELIAMFWNRRTPVRPEHEAILARMERVVEVIKNEQAIEA